MLKIPLCPNCGDRPMGWLKKLLGLTLKCNSCGEKLRHDFLWSLITLLFFSWLGYMFIGYFGNLLVLIPVLVLASLIIIVTPLKHKPRVK